MATLLNNEKIVLILMGIVAFLVTQALKWMLVKPFTKNLNKRAKTVINSVILIIAFGAAVLCEYLYSHFWLNTAINLQRASYGWGYASGIYGIVEMIVKFIKGDSAKVENPYNTEIGKTTTAFVENITKDGKIDQQDEEIVKEFLENIKKEN